MHPRKKTTVVVAVVAGKLIQARQTTVAMAVVAGVVIQAKQTTVVMAVVAGSGDGTIGSISEGGALQ